jgi:NTE family protein
VLESHLRAKTFSDLKIPLFVAATDLNNGKIVYFSEGELLNPVIASASIPVLFNPVIINNIHFVDGGVMDNLPIAPIEKSCDLLIGSFVNPAGYVDNFSSMIAIAERTFVLNLYKELLQKARRFDLYIAPPELSNYSVLDPEKAEEIYKIGYSAALDLLKTERIKDLFNPVIHD